MITATKDGKTYEITEEDQRQIALLTIENGGDVNKAVADFHAAKFGEPFHTHRYVQVATVDNVRVFDCQCGARRRVIIGKELEPEVVLENVRDGSINNVLHDVSQGPRVQDVPAILR